MTNLAPFDSCRFKVLRARQLIKELDYELHCLADPGREVPSDPIHDWDVLIEAAALMRPAKDVLQERPLGKAINNVKNNAPELLA
jgi:hypothetical protein